MACEQMRWTTERVNMLQTDEDKRRLAEEVEKVRKAMAGLGKKVTVVIYSAWQRWKRV